MEPRTIAARDSHPAGESGVESRRRRRPRTESRRLLRAREPIRARRSDNEADGVRKRRVDVRRNPGLVGDRWRDRGMIAAGTLTPTTFEIPCRDGLTIRGDLYRPASPVGSVVICHGFKGFAHWAFFPYLASKLAQAELTAITFDFSGSGIGPDRESFTQPEAFASNTFTRELEDLELLEEYARRRRWISGKFGLLGHSRGGGMAILYAAAEGSMVGSLVTWAAISYPNRWSPEDVLTWRKRGYSDITNSRTGQVMKLGTDLLD